MKLSNTKKKLENNNLRRNKNKASLKLKNNYKKRRNS